MSVEIKKFQKFSREESLLEDFIKALDGLIIEAKNWDVYKKFQKKIISDLGLDLSLITTYGTGLTAFYPIVEEMMKKMSFSADITKDTVVLLTITAISAIYLEEKSINSEQESKLTKDSKSMLEELRMRGIGDGIVKKVMKFFKSIAKLFSLIGKHIGAVVGSFVDMFGYAALLIPFLNAIFYIIGKYELNLDTALKNLYSMSIGIGTKIAKHSLIHLLNSLKDKISKKDKEEIIAELEEPLIKKFGDIKDKTTKSGDLITEQ